MSCLPLAVAYGSSSFALLPGGCLIADAHRVDSAYFCWLIESLALSVGSQSCCAVGLSGAARNCCGEPCI
jgi:hypothetical protein